MIRKILSVILALAVSLSMVQVGLWAADDVVAATALEAAESFAGGSGTPDSPYEIETAGQLKLLAEKVNEGDTEYNSAYYMLTADIDLGGSEENQWTPIGTNSNNFKGIFDGDGHLISGLYINSTNDYQGLFGNVYGGTIQNLGVDGDVTGARYVGGVVGNSARMATVNNCYNTGEVTGTTYVGGVVGHTYLTVQNCYNAGEVSGTGDYVGGVVGFVNEASAVKNCYNTGTVSGTGNYVGGVVGSNDGSRIVQNCYNTGAVSGTGNYVGGVAGYNDTNSTVQNCFFLSGTLDGVGGGSGTNTNVTGIDTAEFALQSTFDTYWDFDTVWKMDGMLGRPILVSLSENTIEGSGDSNTDPYLIKTAKELALVATLVNGGNSFSGKFLSLLTTSTCQACAVRV